jgi:hypothetical protein
MPGRKKKEIVIPSPPQHAVPNGDTQWDAQTGAWVWSANRLAIEELKRQKKIEKRDRHADVALNSFRNKQIEKAAVALDETVNSTETLKAPEARKLLQEAGIEHPGVFTALLRDIPVACEQLGIAPNAYVYRHGILAAMRSQLGEVPLVPEHEFIQEDENLYTRAEIDRLYGDYAYHCGAYKGKSQAEWLLDRAKFRFDMYFAGTEVFGIFGDEHSHRDFMLPWFGDESEARTLPRIYTQKDIIEMYRRIAGPKKEQDHLLMCHRGLGKSTWTSVYVSQSIVRCGDVRVLLITATLDLARQLLELARGKFVCEDFSAPSRFLSLFPEHAIPEGSDSRVFESPMRRLKLKEKTIAITSADSSSSGKRCDVGIFDDFIGDGTGDKALTHEAAVKEFDVRFALVDSHGQRKVIGTPYTIGDLYATLIQRNANRNGNLHFLKGPVWTVKKEFISTPIRDLTIDKVDMLDRSGRIDFDKILEHAIDSPVSFSRQYMCEPAFSDNDDFQIFSRDEFIKGWIPEGSIPLSAQWYSVWDLAYGSQHGDFTCGLVGARWHDNEGIVHLAIRECFMEKIKPSDAVNVIVDQYRRFGGRFLKVGIEKLSSFETVQKELLEASRVRLSNGVVPFEWISIDRTPNAKTTRIRSIQLLSGHEPPLLHWIQGGDFEKLWDQCETWRPNKKSGKSDRARDDGPDCLGLMIAFLNIANQIRKKEKPKVDDGQARNDMGMTKEEFLAWNEQRQISAGYAREMHDRMFSAAPLLQSMTESQWQEKQRNSRGFNKPTESKPSWARGAWGLFLKEGSAINASGKRDKNGNPVKP